MTDQILYRFETVDNERTVGLHCDEYHVYKTTPNGFWIPKHSYDKPGHYWFEKQIERDGIRRHCRWVSSGGRKRFAYANKESAFASFQIRKRHYVSRLEYRLEIAKLSTKLTLEQPLVAKPSEFHFLEI